MSLVEESRWQSPRLKHTPFYVLLTPQKGPENGIGAQKDTMLRPQEPANSTPAAPAGSIARMDAGYLIE
jgi:hypothetical protein